MERRSLAFAVISGFLLAASFPAVDLGFLAWLGLVPLLAAIDGKNAKQAFSLGFATGIVFYSGTIFWLAHSLHVYGGLHLLFASLITLLLCIYLAVYPALFCAVLAHIRNMRPSFAFLAAPAVWTALEFCRTYVLSGFPWALLGYTQYRFLPVIQAADITGIYGISFIIVFTNAGIAELIKHKRFLPLVSALALFSAVVAYGFIQLRAPEGKDRIRASVIQGNIEQDRKWNLQYQAEVFATYKKLSQKALVEKPDIVIWPETATPFYFGSASKVDAVFSKDIRQFVKTHGTPLLFGAPAYERKPSHYFSLKNSAYLLDKNGMTTAVYHKLHLVPFGEYVPLKKSILFFINRMVKSIDDFEPGTDYTIMQIQASKTKKDIQLGTVICYEIIFPDLVRRFVKSNAAVIINITNDAWFGKTSAPYQHFAMAVFRAIENRVPIARAANTGISGFIDAKGRILEMSDIFKEAVLTRDLFSGNDKTFYTRYGDIFAWLCLIATVIFAASHGENLKTK